jgi:shikimate dehydrogenase
MQNAGIEALGLNWRYTAFDVHPNSLREAIAGAKAMRFIGLNLTVPHKLLALDMVDVIDSEAKKWGAINTIRFEGQQGDNWLPLPELPPDTDALVRSVGFNTDADAIVRSLKEDLGVLLTGSKILLLGAGGAGRAAALRLAEEKPAELWLVNRTQSKAEELALEIQSRQPSVAVKVGYPNKFVDLVLNATSLGLKADDPLPIDENQFPLKQAEYAYDMIYKPAKTPFLVAAEANGCFIANGLGMLLYQGARALELWSGKTPPLAEMREALTRHIYGHV